MCAENGIKLTTELSTDRTCKDGCVYAVVFRQILPTDLHCLQEEFLEVPKEEGGYIKLDYSNKINVFLHV